MPNTLLLAALTLMLACAPHANPSQASEPSSGGAREAGREDVSSDRLTPSPGEVSRALGGRNDEVVACLAPGQCVVAALAFADDGSLSQIALRGDESGSYCGTGPHAAPSAETEACVRRALRPIRLAPFRQTPFGVSFPFRREP